jgi:phage shock protein PspC (stress-responsive transcriptional regulator)
VRDPRRPSLLGVSGKDLVADRRKWQHVDDIHQNFAKQGLVRPRDGRVLGGVCAGLGQRFGIAPWPARILFMLLLMVIPGSQLLIYPILWILMPTEESVSARPSWPATGDRAY